MKSAVVTNHSHILVVDDDVPIRKLLVAVLTDSGHAVSEAIHGAHALDMLAHTPVDLVISDIMMPLMDGIALCRRVKAMPGIACILMSSAPPPTPFNAGQDAFLAKPFDLDAVEDIVATVLSATRNAD